MKFKTIDGDKHEPDVTLYWYHWFKVTTTNMSMMVHCTSLVSIVLQSTGIIVKFDSSTSGRHIFESQKRCFTQGHWQCFCTPRQHNVILRHRHCHKTDTKCWPVDIHMIVSYFGTFLGQWSKIKSMTHLEISKITEPLLLLTVSILAVPSIPKILEKIQMCVSVTRTLIFSFRAFWGHWSRAGNVRISKKIGTDVFPQRIF